MIINRSYLKDFADGCCITAIEDLTIDVNINNLKFYIHKGSKLKLCKFFNEHFLVIPLCCGVDILQPINKFTLEEKFNRFFDD